MSPLGHKQTLHDVKTHLILARKLAGAGFAIPVADVIFWLLLSQSSECFFDAHWCEWSGVHILEVRLQAWQMFKQVHFLSPIKSIGEDEISNCHAIPYNELTIMHMLVKNRGHLQKIISRDSNFFRYALLFWIEICMPRHSP